MRAWFIGAAALLLGGCLVPVESSEASVEVTEDVGVAEQALDLNGALVDAPGSATTGASEPGAEASGPEPDPWHDDANTPSNPEPDPWQTLGLSAAKEQPGTTQASAR